MKVLVCEYFQTWFVIIIPIELCDVKFVDCCNL
jgi:hypothetical protein